MMRISDKKKNIIFIFIVVILVMSLIPIFIIAGFDCASGDDYNYGALSHHAIVNGEGFFKAIYNAGVTTYIIWKGWQGTWFDCFIFCLHPEVFSDSAYVIVPYIFVIMQVVAYLAFSHHFLKVRWNLGEHYWAIIGMIFLIFSFQLIPSHKSGIFWWVGCVHYVMPMCMALWGIIVGDRFLIWHRTKDLLLLCIVSFLIGGATYPAALLLPISVLGLWFAGFVFGTDVDSECEIAGGRDKRNYFLIIPFVLEAIGLTVSIIAPGNSVRSVSDISNGARPSGGVVETIIKSIIFSVTDAIDMFIMQKTFVIIMFIVIFSFTMVVFNSKSEDREFKVIFAHPLLFACVMFLINAAMYAPRLYAGGIVSSGYYNFNFWTFCICVIAIIIYMCGYWSFVKGIKVENGNLRKIGLAVLAISFIVMFLGRHGVKEYTDYVCIEYYLSGQAADYKEQIALQRLLMEEEGVDDVVVPEINNEQGPLMQMPIVSDTENVDNTMTASFYDKNSCRSISRNEWIEIYGEKYGVKH